VRAYLRGGVDKVVDFEGAVVEVRHFGLICACLPVPWLTSFLKDMFDDVQ